jgi:hypothetical protein
MGEEEENTPKETGTMIDLTDKKQFELFAAAQCLVGLMSKDGHAFRSNLAQDEAQQLTEALAKRGFFDKTSEDAQRYKSPVPRRQNVNQVQQDMIVVDDR